MKCLVTRLKEAVSDTSLERLDELVVEFSYVTEIEAADTHYPAILIDTAAGDAVELEIDGSCNIYVGSQKTNATLAGKKYTHPGGRDYYGLDNPGKGDFKLRIVGKSKLLQLPMYYETWTPHVYNYYYDFERMAAYADRFTKLILTNFTGCIDLSRLKNLDSLEVYKNKETSSNYILDYDISQMGKLTSFVYSQATSAIPAIDAATIDFSGYKNFWVAKPGIIKGTMSSALSSLTAAHVAFRGVTIPCTKLVNSEAYIVTCEKLSGNLADIGANYTFIMAHADGETKQEMTYAANPERTKMLLLQCPFLVMKNADTYFNDLVNLQLDSRLEMTKKKIALHPTSEITSASQQARDTLRDTYGIEISINYA